MPHRISHLLHCLALIFSLAANGAAAAAGVIDDAVKRYYAGYPVEAIAMLRPVASAGNADAQYLLGNMLYSLAGSGQVEESEDPVKWYGLAAEQGSAQANYALGAIYNNRWLQSRLDEDASLSQSYFERALELGDDKARAALAKIKASRKSRSLNYTNESFSSKQSNAPVPGKAELPSANPAPGKATLAEVLSDFQSSGDSVADAESLQRLLGGLHAGGESQNGDPATAGKPDLSTLRQMLGNFESVEELFSDLLQLYEHIDTASELGTEPGAN